MKRTRVDAEVSSKPIVISQALQRIYQSPSTVNSSYNPTVLSSSSSTENVQPNISSSTTNGIIPNLELITPNEEIRLTAPNVKLTCGLQSLGTGILYITTE